MKLLIKPRDFWVEDGIKFCTFMVIGMTLEDKSDVAGTAYLKLRKRPGDDFWGVAFDSKVRLPAAWFDAFIEALEDVYAKKRAAEMYEEVDT